MAVSVSPVSAASYSRSSWRDLDWLLLFLVIALSIWSCATIYSATRPNEDVFVARPSASSSTASSSTAVDSAGNGASRSASARRGARTSDVLKQVIWIALGLAAIALVAALDFQLLMHLQFWIYLGTLAILGLVLALPRSIAPVINGAKSWIILGPLGSLQPSELAKVGVIITLAAFLCRRQERIGRASTLVWSLLYITPPLLLILKQPDFGTMLSVLSIWFGMLFFGGARLWHLALVAFIGLSLFGAAWKLNVLKPHQKARLSVFMDTNPSTRAGRDAGYHIKQSQIAIGAGQITGEGFGRGMQNRGAWVPEKTTDFIFAVVAEELGFVGGAILLLLYLVLLGRSALLAMTTDNYFGVLIAGGFTSLIAFHAIVNLGMTMRVMPITGVPLPFFSYGGSSYVAFSLCVGLLQSIALRRKRTSGG